MIRFTDRNSVITYIKECTERRSIERAIKEGQIEYLGGFSQTGPTTRSPIWICRITSTYDKTWVVAVYINGAITYLRGVPWEYYVGGSSNNPLYSGDNPKEYIGFRRLSYFKYKRKQRSAQDWTSHSREDNGTANNAPLDTTNSVSMSTRLRVGIKNLWERFF